MNSIAIRHLPRRTTPLAVRSRRRHGQKGSSLVELAICFLAFLMLTMGTLDFAWAVYANGFCFYAARDASRWLSVHGANSATSTNCSGNPGIASGCAANSTDVSNFVTLEAVGLDTSKLTVTTTWTPDTNPGAEVNVTVAYTVVPLSGLGLKENLNVTSSSQMEMLH